MSILSRLRPRMQDQGETRPLYLVSTAGHPNLGDELITRAWLDLLAREHPDRDVWLDCPQPGRAAHLFADTHPRLRVTNTLWELAHGSETHDPVSDAPRVARIIRELGSPRFDEGLLCVRRAESVHLLGGGYLNTIWQDNLGVLTAAVTLREHFGIRIVATGLGLMPLEGGTAAWARDALSAFDHVEARDEPSAEQMGVPVGCDDAFLALALDRPVYANEPAPDRMVLVQGDVRSWDDDDALRLIDDFAAEGGAGFAEAIPPDDHRYVELRCGAEEFYPFGRMWHDGLPMRRGQRWLTSRFHVHLLGAAAGAAGVVVAGRPGYYDVKHESLLRLGTGWNVVDAGERITADAATVDPGFPGRARHLAAEKLAAGRALYAAA